MAYFKIYAGLGGGFGGGRYQETSEFKNRDEAEEYAFGLSCEQYDSYAGMYGIREIDEIMEEDEVDEEDAELIYNEERESWLSYSAVDATGPDDTDD